MNCHEHFLVFVSAVSRCVSISAFTSLVGIAVGIGSSALGLKICAITAAIEEYLSELWKKKERSPNSIVLLTKTKLNTIEALIFKDLIDSCINNEEFVSVNNVCREFNEIKESIKNTENAVEYTT